MSKDAEIENLLESRFNTFSAPDFYNRGFYGGRGERRCSVDHIRPSPKPPLPLCLSVAATKRGNTVKRAVVRVSIRPDIQSTSSLHQTTMALDRNSGHTPVTLMASV